MKVFAKENSILGGGKRREQRHIGLIGPPSSPFSQWFQGMLKWVSPAVFCCPYKKGSCWAYDGASSYLPLLTYIPCPALFTFETVQIPELGRNFLYG